MINIIVREGCPYCQKVQDFIKISHLENKINFISKEDDEDKYQKLREQFNVKTVPFAFKEDLILNDSSLIIDYLKNISFENLW